MYQQQEGEREQGQERERLWVEVHGYVHGLDVRVRAERVLGQPVAVETERMGFDQHPVPGLQ